MQLRQRLALSKVRIMTTPDRSSQLGDRIAALAINQKLLWQARAEALLQPHPISNKLLAFRVNPSSPEFPIAYRRLDKKTLEEVAALV